MKYGKLSTFPTYLSTFSVRLEFFDVENFPELSTGLI